MYFTQQMCSWCTLLSHKNMHDNYLSKVRFTCKLNPLQLLVFQACVKGHCDSAKFHITTKSNTVLTSFYVYALIFHSCFQDRLEQIAKLCFILQPETHSVQLLLLRILWHLNHVFTYISNWYLTLQTKTLFCI